MMSGRDTTSVVAGTGALSASWFEWLSGGLELFVLAGSAVLIAWNIYDKFKRRRQKA
jgi:hypothetical protein